MDQVLHCFYKEKEIKYINFSKLNNEALDPYLFTQNNHIRKEILGWVKGYNLSEQKEIWLPAQTIYLNFQEKYTQDSLRREISTGGAGASSPEKAILNGIYELIERDSFL